MLGTVAPRDPLTRQLGERRWRLDLLSELCDQETFRLVAEWLANKQIPSVQTKQAYADDVRHWARIGKELCGTEPWYLGCITSDVLPSWRLWAEKQKHSPRTINRRLASLNSLVEFVSWRTKTPLVSPVSRYDRAKVDIHDATTATPILEVEGFQRVVGVCTSAWQALVPTLIYTVAGRVSECCTAMIHDLHRTESGRQLDLRRKGGKGSVFTLPPTLCSLIDVATDGRTGGPLLLKDNGQPMARHDVANLLTKLGKLAGVLPDRDLTPHVLRASKLTHMYDEDVPVDDIRRFADHSDISTTLRYIRRRDDSTLKARHAQAAATVYETLLDRWA
jgi:integrase